MKMTTDNYLSNEKRLAFLTHERLLLDFAYVNADTPQKKQDALKSIDEWGDINYEDLMRCTRIDAQFDALEEQI
jgi:hypothetical protein